MHLFYSPDLKDDHYELSQDDSKHCIKVLRLKKGDLVYLTDGKGTLYKARIIHDDLRSCRVEVVEKQYDYGKRPFYLHIAIAPTKNIKRFEWFLEKSTEIGIDEITPLICFHSERRQLKTDRSNRIITAAIKQSLKTYHPVLNEVVHYNEFVESGIPGEKFIAYFDQGYSKHFKNQYVFGKDATIVIGPEGDFSQQELDKAMYSGFNPVSLGKSRLRTETAGVVATSIINLLNE